MVFRFDGPFVDRTTGEECGYPMRRANRMHSVLERWLRREDSIAIVSGELLGNVSMEAQKFKALRKDRFIMSCEMGLYTLKLHFLHHTVEDVDRFGSLELLNSSASERSNLHMKWVCQSMLQWRGSVMQETVRVVEATGQEIREELVALRKEKRWYVVER